MASKSPVADTQMDFPTALSYVVNGRRITKLEWDNPDDFGMLRGSWLMLYKGGKWHTWIVSEGDLLGTDWVICRD